MGNKKELLEAATNNERFNHVLNACRNVRNVYTTLQLLVGQNIRPDEGRAS